MALFNSLKGALSSAASAVKKKLTTPVATKAPSTLVLPKVPAGPMSVIPRSSTIAMPKAGAPVPFSPSLSLSPAAKKNVGAAAVGAGLGLGAASAATSQPKPPTFSAPVIPQVKPQTSNATTTTSPTVPRVTPDASTTVGAPASGTTPSGTPAAPKAEKPEKPKPAIPTAAEKAVADAEKIYQDSIEVDNDELSTQADLDRLSESTKKAYTGINDQAIPLQFITGQLKSVENRALDLAEPLETRLARMQAARTNAIESSKFSLERADAKLKADKEAKKPIEIGGSLIRPNATGGYDTVYSAPTEDKLLSPTEAASLGVPYGTTQSQAFGKTPAADDGLTPYQQFQATQAIQKTTQTNTDASRELSRQGTILNDTWARYQRGEAGDLNATTQAIVTTFNKILDPTSVVRETEYDRSASGQALIQSIEGKLASIAQGGPGLTPASLKELVDLGTTYSKNAQASIEKANARAREQAQYFGLNPDFVTSSDYKETTASLEDYYRGNPAQRPNIDKLIQENPALSDDDILQIISGGSFSSSGAGATNRPQRNNNPLNIKASDATLSYAGVSGTDPSPASDGGKFLVFNSPQAGFDAAARLLKTSGYLNLTVDGAMKRWSNSGYGGEVAPSLTNRTIASLSASEIQSLIEAMARREGYYA